MSGINGVEWDAVELPSQFMENFCWEWDVRRAMTPHVDTSAQRCRARCSTRCSPRRTSRAACRCVRQIEFALFDMHLHYDFDPRRESVARSARRDADARRWSSFRRHYNRFPNSFSHIFAGGYAAGYYSYKWAEVLSADAYSLFEENGVLDPAHGRARFRDEILAVGGSRPGTPSCSCFVAVRPGN